MTFQRSLLMFGMWALLVACSSDPADPIGSPIDARALWLNADCGVREQLVDLPQLENLLVQRHGASRSDALRALPWRAACPESG